MRTPPLLLLTPLLLVTTWLGVRGLDADILWGDELWSILDAGGVYYGPLTPVGIWQQVAERNPWHVPGFFVLLSGWGRLVDWTPAGLRVFALLAGLLAVAWTYRLGRDLVTPSVGVYAAVILGVSVFFTHYMHEVRMYTLLVALTAFTLWAYFRIVTARREPGLLLYAGLFAGALGLLYTHYFGAFTLAVIGVYHLWQGVQKLDRRWWRVVLALAAAGLLFLPWTPVLLTGVDRTTDTRSLLDRLVRALDTGANIAFMFSNGAWLLLLGLVGFAFTRRDGRGRRALYIGLAMLAVVLLASMVVTVKGSLRSVRYYLAIWTPLALVAGLGIAQIELFARKWVSFSRTGAARQGIVSRFIALAVLTIWVVVAAFNLNNPTIKDVDGSQFDFPLHRVTRALSGVAQPEDAVISFVRDGLRYADYEIYGQLANFYFHIDAVGADDLMTTTARYDGQAAEEGTYRRNFARDRQRVWLATVPGETSTALADYQTFLADLYTPCEPTINDAGVRVDQYTLSRACCLNHEKLSTTLARYDAGIQLVAVDAQPGTNRAELPVTVLWSLAPELPPNEFSATINVMNAEGERVAHVDYGLLPQAFTCQQTTLPLVDLPPGTYQVMAGVYPWRTGTRMNGVLLTDGQVSDLLPVATFTIP